MRSDAKKLNALSVSLDDRQIGVITRLAGDRQLFAFDEDYIDDPQRSTLSLSFKGSTGGLVTNFGPVGRRVPVFFSNLLPEGHLRDYLAQRTLEGRGRNCRAHRRILDSARTRGRFARGTEESNRQADSAGRRPGQVTRRFAQDRIRTLDRRTAHGEDCSGQLRTRRRNALIYYSTPRFRTVDSTTQKLRSAPRTHRTELGILFSHKIRQFISDILSSSDCSGRQSQLA